MTVTVAQDGANVTASYDGAMNTLDFTSEGTEGAFSFVNSAPQFLIVGGAVSPGTVTGSHYGSTFDSGLAGAFSGNSDVFASAVSGGILGIYSTEQIILPLNYTGGDEISGSSTWDDTTIAALGLNVGSFTGTYGLNATLVLNIGQSVPEPASLALLAAGLAGLGVVRRRKRSARVLFK